MTDLGELNSAAQKLADLAEQESKRRQWSSLEQERVQGAIRYLRSYPDKLSVKLSECQLFRRGGALTMPTPGDLERDFGIREQGALGGAVQGYVEAAVNFNQILDRFIEERLARCVCGGEKL